jgi:hypothetical protein
MNRRFIVQVAFCLAAAVGLADRLRSAEPELTLEAPQSADQPRSVLKKPAESNSKPLPAAESKGGPRPAVATSPAEADDDFPLQGEYVGNTFTPLLGSEYTGLQVAALGNGEFRAVQFRHGLPGSGWNRVHQFTLTGQREGNMVRLTARGRYGTYTALVGNERAELRNAAWQLVGRLRKIRRISPTMGVPPPPGAIVLFDGSNVDEFVSGEIVDGHLLLAGAVTQRRFRDFRLHVEFKTPYMPYARGQGRGNSGVYIQKRYEVQILDSFTLSGEANECGGLYRQRPPDLNMAFPPLSWQTYDIDFAAARFNDLGQKVQNARLTVAHNGVVIHDDVELPNKTGAGDREGPEPGPIRFQWHSDLVHFRNLWIVETGETGD